MLNLPIGVMLLLEVKQSNLLKEKLLLKQVNLKKNKKITFLSNFFPILLKLILI